ncbi:hypothetical protein L209DRAFT_6363 [Thermothelomyces heterothallicus CBS 203.75]
MAASKDIQTGSWGVISHGWVIAHYGIGQLRGCIGASGTRKAPQRTTESRIDEKTCQNRRLSSAEAPQAASPGSTRTSGVVPNAVGPEVSAATRLKKDRGFTPHGSTRNHRRSLASFSLAHPVANLAKECSQPSNLMPLTSLLLAQGVPYDGRTRQQHTPSVN